MKKNVERYGDWIDYTEDEVKEMYRCIDGCSDEAGICRDDLKKSFMIYRHCKA